MVSMVIAVNHCHYFFYGPHALEGAIDFETRRSLLFLEAKVRSCVTQEPVCQDSDPDSTSCFLLWLCVSEPYPWSVG